jgi:hypothetical protein
VKRALILLAALLLLFLVGEAGLFLVGKLPQDAILDSIQASLPQLEAEYEKPYVLHDRSRNGIDNFTDCLILNLSFCMDTKSGPSAVLSNPLYWTNGLDPFQELNLVANGQEANGEYINYCMGFRIWMRPLLTLFNYMEIRTMFSFATWMLFGLSLITVFRVSQSRLFSTLYALCIVSLNPIAISSSLTYMPSFLIAFWGMLLIPKVAANKERKPLGVPLLFLCLGAVTQFFDFYTYPLITFAFPMILLLTAKQQGLEVWKPRDSFALLARGIGTWLFGYIGIWLCKLGATAIFTKLDVLTNAINVLNNSVSVVSATTGLWTTISACAENILTPEVLLSFVVVAAVWLVLFLKNPDRKARVLESWVYLVIGVLSIVWIAFAKRTYLHRFFQYRVLGVFVMGVFAFFAQTARRTAKKHETLPKEEQQIL